MIPSNLPDFEERYARRWGALTSLASSDRLLVACDFDGTLAPIVSNPSAARPHRLAIASLRALQELPNTNVAVVSGRASSDLSRVVGLPDSIALVGSHGAETDGLRTESLNDQRGLWRQLQTIGDRIAQLDSGIWVETKPFGIAVHYRSLPRRRWDEIERLALLYLNPVQSVTLRSGKAVVEASILDVTKADAVRELRKKVAASAVLYAGDDVTDEDAFSALHTGDLGIKVGPGPTRASLRVATPKRLARLLSRLAALRGTHLSSPEEQW